MISIISAMSLNKVIGKDGQIPWHLSSDLKRFKKLTTNKPIVMGRKTFESIGKPLKDRLNIIITSDENYLKDNINPNILIVNDVLDIFLLEKQFKEIMIIGGQKIYEYFLPHATNIYLTLVFKKIDGDTYFPEIDMNTWKIEEYEDIVEKDINFTFIHLTKR